MEVWLVFDPSLNLSADQFTIAWNGNPDCAAVAHAAVQPTPTTTFLRLRLFASGKVIGLQVYSEFV